MTNGDSDRSNVTVAMLGYPICKRILITLMYLAGIEPIAPTNDSIQNQIAIELSNFPVIEII